MGMGLCTSRTTAVKMVGTGMTREKLQKMAELSRVGGVRRTHKAVRKGAATGEDAKLAAGLKKMGVSHRRDRGGEPDHGQRDGGPVREPEGPGVDPVEHVRRVGQLAHDEHG